MVISLAAATLGLMPSAAGCGQDPEIVCEQGEPVGDLGIDGFGCDCTVSTDAGRRRWSFRNEPEILAVDPDGPAAGRLEPGDVLVALDGVAITDPEAGLRFANLPPRESIRLTVRRGGDERTVEVTTAAICPDDPRGLEHDTPQVRGGSSTPFPSATGAGRSVAHAGPLPPVPPVPPSMPTGWLGLGLQCSHCGWEQETGSPIVWEFQAPPLVYRMDPDGPAAEAGILDGDTLLMIGGVALTTVEGGTRFGAIQPGDEVELTVGRPGGRETVVVTALRAPGAPSAPATPATPATPSPTARAPRSPRYVGSVGNARVEVLGSGSVIVNVPDPGREIEILTDDATIRVRAPEAPDR
jgi:hypothetical protein